MPQTISQTRKLKEKRGEGTGANYKPWIKARELNSLGTAHNIVDWKHGRTIELLSEGEAMAYYLLRWDENVADIQEHFPLDLITTNQLADRLGIKRFHQGKENMNTDFLVTYKDGSQRAYSLKFDRKLDEKPREIEKSYLEKMYWKLHGVEWETIYKSDLSEVKVNNIRLCVEYYDFSKVHDSISFLKYLISHRILCPDLEKGILEFDCLLKSPDFISWAQDYRKRGLL